MKLALCAVLSLLLIGSAAAVKQCLDRQVAPGGCRQRRLLCQLRQPERFLQARLSDHARCTLPERM